MTRPKRQYAVRDDTGEDLDYDRALDYMNRTGRWPDEELDHDGEPEPPRSAWAVVALICGIIAVFSPVGRVLSIVGLLAIVFGHIARHDIKRGVASGKSLATWGLGLGYASLVLTFIVNMSEN